MLRFLLAITSRAASAASETNRPTSRIAAGQRPISDEKKTASRAAAHRPNSASSGFPAIGRRPVQFGIAVSKNPLTAAPTKPNSISWRCQATGSNCVGSWNCPVSEQSHRTSAMRPHVAAPKKNGLNPPRRNGCVAAMRRLRSASICSPRVTVFSCICGHFRPCISEEDAVPRKHLRQSNMRFQSKITVSRSELSSTAETECFCPRSK